MRTVRDDAGKILVQWFREDWAMFQHPRMDDSRAKDLLGEILDDGEIARQTFVTCKRPHNGPFERVGKVPR